MPTLEELRKKYPKANHEPLEGCSKCGGTGEVSISEEKRKKMKCLSLGEKMPCMCIFMSHDNLELARRALKEVVDDMKNGEVTREIQRIIKSNKH